MDKNLSESQVSSRWHEPFGFDSHFKTWSFVNISIISSCSGDGEPWVENDPIHCQDGGLHLRQLSHGPEEMVN